jgi:hypothetical protein
MTLTFDPNPGGRYQHGYWYAATDDGGYDADGATPEAALASLVVVMESALTERTD